MYVFLDMFRYIYENNDVDTNTTTIVKMDID